jgi:hypothetical protein
MRSGYGRKDSRIPEVEKQIILEETLYLLEFGFRADDADIIQLGMVEAFDNYTPADWIRICDETLRWHCKNFYELGLQHYEIFKDNSKRDGDGNGKRSHVDC